MGKRTWIDHRNEAGYDWSALMVALSKLTVYGGDDGHGLVVDSSAIAPKYFPTRHVLEPGPNGWWKHGPSGSAGPLLDCLASIALTCIERPAAPPMQEEVEEP